ncbi:glutathione S-transferase domain-containing protein [Macrophomina phaseolina]|uniref:Glutathione S-transferase domain-containing protein n=1 Tax=Macrophomina phaseolina TaxID=35725 RepID=A0ABQ8FYG9_9PEZI|nr:glutathione S-transferase domain-containing protein [Macrophomina phaseolina]
MTYRLISATPSPYARKVRIALIEKDIPFELITEVPWNSTTQTPRHNPLETLPVLLIPKPDDGTSTAAESYADAIFESHHILTYLELKHPSSAAPLLPPAHDADARLLALKTQVVADGICDACVLLFFERQRTSPSAAWTARQERKVDGGLAWLARLVDERVGPDSMAFLVGGTFGIADIAVGTVCGYLDCRWPELGWRARWAGLARCVDWLAERESFRRTVPVAQAISDAVV